MMAIGCTAIALLTQDEDDDEEGYGRRGFYVGLSPSYARQDFSDAAVVRLIDGDLQDSLRHFRATATPVVPATNPPTFVDPGFATFSLDDIDSDTFGVSGRVGYRCHSRVSAELQFEWLDKFQGSLSENNAPPVDDSARGFDLLLEPLVFTVNAKGHLLTGRTQPFVLAGFGFMRMESKSRDVTGGTVVGFAPDARERDVNVAGRFGGGIDFYLTENAVVTAEASYLMPAGKLDEFDYYSIGIGLQYRF